MVFDAWANLPLGISLEAYLQRHPDKTLPETLIHAQPPHVSQHTPPAAIKTTLPTSRSSPPKISPPAATSVPRQIVFPGEVEICVVNKTIEISVSSADYASICNFLGIIPSPVLTSPRPKIIIPLNSSNAFLCWHALKPYQIKASQETKKLLGALYKKNPVAKATLSDDRKYVEFSFPPCPQYRHLVKTLTAYPQKNGGYRIPISKVLDFKALNDQISGVPKIVLDKSVQSVYSDPLPGFTGEITSLRNVPIDALNIVQANTQNWKQLKTSRKTLTEKMVEFGIGNLYDLVMVAPKRYIDKSNPQKIGSLIVGETATIIGKISKISDLNGRGLRIDVTQGKENISCIFFNQTWLTRKFKTGDDVIVTGEYKPWVSNYGITYPQISSPLMEHLEYADTMPIVPVYKQAQSKGITTALIIACMRELLSRAGKITLPNYLIQNGRPTYDTLLNELHFPSSIKNYHKAIYNLAYYELVYMQLIIQDTKRRSDIRPGIQLPPGLQNLQEKALTVLPFTMTDAQQQGLDFINKRIKTATPASMLLNADVGAGKGLLSTAKIHTPAGWKTLKNLRVGDYVTGSDGQATCITGYYPQGVQTIARLTFSDGTSIVTDLAHRWTIINHKHGKKVMSTKDLLAEYKRGISNYIIPTISSPVEYFRPQFLPRELSNFSKILASTTLQRHYIPPAVYRLPSKHRLEFLSLILNGIPKLNSANTKTCTVPPSLITGVTDLLRSCGYTVKQSGRSTITISCEPRTIVKVQQLESMAETICIKVDAKDELFVTEHYIVTHNTLLSQLACLRAVENGYQAVLAAPTDILARQLYASTTNLIEDINQVYNLSLNVDLYSGSLPVKDKREIGTKIKNGETNIIVGTHSLFSETVTYKNLGIVCVDEQQKFGVKQRTKLLYSRTDDKIPHLLMLTATPIPRTVAQAVYGDVDIVTLQGKPVGRLPIETQWVQEDPQDVISQPLHPIWSDIIAEAQLGRQTFIVTPLVNASEKIDAASVEATFETLKKGALKGLRIGFSHGKMKPTEQQEAMQKFRAKQYDVFIASTIVEVGVDIPSATRMVVLSADRLGASSLHQIRGRVGRNSFQSKCYLVSNPENEDTCVRLESIASSEDGFQIAITDLKNRGEGKVFSTSQSGKSELIFASLNKDTERISAAKQEATLILDSRYGVKALNDAKTMFETEERVF